MAVPYTFGTATSSIPLSQLDSNFNTVITLGNTAIQLGNTVTTLNNMTLANVTISSGNVTITNVAITTANVTTANITTAVIGTATITTSTTTTGNVTTANITTGNITNGTVITSLTLSYGTANGVAYLNGSKVLTTGSAFVFDGTNVGIGTSSPLAKLVVSNAGAQGIEFGYSSGLTANFLQSIDRTGAGSDVDMAYYLAATGVHKFYTQGTERMRIDASGNVGIGVVPDNTYPARLNLVATADCTLRITKAAVVATSIKAVTTAMTFGVDVAAGDTERMRIDTSGNLLVGTTSLNGGITGITNNLNTMTTRNTGATAGKFWKAPYVDASNQLYIINNSNTGVYITDGGVAWIANSDERLKTTLTPFENAVEKICSLRSGTGRYLVDDESISRSFLLAQDVQKILPEAVNAQNDEQKTLGLAYTDLIPLLVAAIKEQQALITSLTARITALER